MRRRAALPLAALLLAAAPAPRTPAEIADAAPAADWEPIAPDRLLLLELADKREVAIELAPDFAPVHIANIRRLADTGWFDGTSVNRVQDGYVVQWGDASETKPLPSGIVVAPPPEYERPLAGIAFAPLPFTDSYAPQAGTANGWPVAADGRSAWLVHCYGMVGVGRNDPPDTGTGAELYAVIGHAPRQLDRNISLVGRVVGGFDALTSLPRGTAPLGFYAEPAERTPIVRARLASALPAGTAPRYEVMRTGSASYRTWADARANRRDPFYVRPAGAADVCTLAPPVRRAGA